MAAGAAEAAAAAAEAAQPERSEGQSDDEVEDGVGEVEEGPSVLCMIGAWGRKKREGCNVTRRADDDEL